MPRLHCLKSSSTNRPTRRNSGSSANSFVALGQLDDAIANLELAHRVAAPQANSLTLLGDLYLTQDAAVLALDCYQNALRSSPELKPEQALSPLRRLMQLGRYDAANSYLQVLRQTLTTPMSPQQSSEVAVFEAQLQIEDGQVDAGLSQLEALLQADPLNHQALLYMAEVQLGNEAFARAEFYYERAKSIPAAQVEALIGLGRTAVAQAKFDDALNYLRHSQQLQTRDDVAAFIARIEQVVAAH